MSPQIDLSALQRPEPTRAVRRKVPYVSRYVIPSLLLVSFAALLGWSAREHFVARKPVQVVPVVMSRAAVRAEGTPLFQAAGWIEPRPTPINVAALTDGVIQSLRVVEGQDVDAGEPVAKLVDVDATWSLREAEAVLALREAELRAAMAVRSAAHERLQYPVHLQAALAEAQSELASKETELAKLPYLIQSSTARVEFAARNLEAKQAAGNVVSDRVRQQAVSDHQVLVAELEALQRQQPILEREVAALQQRQTALAEQLERLIDETRQMEEAEASVLAAQAQRDRARVAVEQARLRLERTTVRSPVAGRVLTLIAHPGTHVQASGRAATGDAGTVVTIYDPRQLQVRVDVRLEDMPHVRLGQPVTLETASSDEPLHGRVLIVTSAANVQKNTLEVKVSLDDPPETVRPEMLVSATFLAPSVAPSETAPSEEPLRLLVPRDLVDTNSGKTHVWIVDAQMNARRRAVQLGQAGTEQLVEVTDGLVPTDKLIVDRSDDLREGDPVVITAEDTRMGVTSLGR